MINGRLELDGKPVRLLQVGYDNYNPRQEHFLMPEGGDLEAVQCAAFSLVVLDEQGDVLPFNGSDKGAGELYRRIVESGSWKVNRADAHCLYVLTHQDVKPMPNIDMHEMIPSSIMNDGSFLKEIEMNAKPLDAVPQVCLEKFQRKVALMPKTDQ